MSREVMQQALEDMACMRDMVAHHDNLEFIDRAINALRAALAEPEQDNRLLMQAYRAVQQQKEQRTEPEQEPVELMGAPLLLNGQPLYTHPPQRKPLTDEELKPIADQYGIVFGGWVTDFARAIEAAHGIKQEEA